MTKQLMLASAIFFGSPTFGEDIEKSLSKYLSSFPQVTLSQVGPVYVLDGTVDMKRDLAELNEIAEALKEKGVAVKFLISLSAHGKQALASYIEKLINSPEISAFFVGDELFIEGTAENDFEADRSIEIAKSAFYSNIARRPAQVDSGRSNIVDLLRIRPAAPPMLLPKTKKLSKAP